MDVPRIARPRSLREALSVAFVHRSRTRWRAGTSRLLGLEYAPPPDVDGFVVDVAEIPEFRAIESERGTLRIGAFADPDRARSDPEVQRSLGGKTLSADVARFRLGALGARLVVAGVGATRSAPLEDVLAADAPRPLAASEIPLAIELRDTHRVSFGDRRLRRNDGAASFDVRIYAALQLAGPHSIAAATVAYALDDGPPLPLLAVDATLRGAQIGRTTFSDAARHAADVFRGNDERSSSLRRTVVPLVLSALKEAYGEGRVRD